MNESNMLTDYLSFLRAKMQLAKKAGFDVEDSEINPILKPHQRDIVRWAISGGQRAIFASFGLGKTIMQLEICRLILKHKGGRGLIICPLGVRGEFMRDAKMLGITLRFVKRDDEVAGDDLYITNYESVREGKINPTGFIVVSLDEASCLRGFGGTKTFREMMKHFEGTSKYRFVATACPDPNEYVELLAYSAFLGTMDIGQAKTVFFKRDSTKADHLTLHPHREKEFWLFLASWAIFLQRPSDFGYSDEGYDLPPITVTWHEIPSILNDVPPTREGQGRLFLDPVLGLSEAAHEKRSSQDNRLEELRKIIYNRQTGIVHGSLPQDVEVQGHPVPQMQRRSRVVQGRSSTTHESSGLLDQLVIWCDLNDEQDAIEKLLDGEGISYSSLRGSQGIDEREVLMDKWRAKETSVLLTKPSIYGSGVNLQQSHTMIFCGIGFKFNDIHQAQARIHRFMQKHECKVHLIYTEAEISVRKNLEDKWERYKKQAAVMSAIIREHGLSSINVEETMRRTIGCERKEEAGEMFRLVNNDTILECDDRNTMPDNSVDLIVTSIPFSFQYEYSPSYNDLGHTESNDHFWQQMDFLAPNLLRVLEPGRVMAIHVKDRIVPGGVSGFGFQTLHPFHAEAIYHYQKHGFAFLGMKTVVTDVVRENNQTYRLGWTEQCKDGSRMGCGVPEYVLLFRKPPTDRSVGYADVPVVKDKPLCVNSEGEPAPFDSEKNWQKPIPGTGYSRSKWQLDAHGFARSDGNRFLTDEDLANLPHNKIFKKWREESLNQIHNHEYHVLMCEKMDELQRLPATFMLLQPASWHPDVWTDIARMRTLNMEQERKGQVMHLCLARGSLVLTSNGYKPIQEVNAGDEVLTHKGRWRRVLVCENTGVRPVVEVRAQGVPGLRLTPDHKLWTRKVRDMTWSKDHSKLEALQTRPDWIESQDTVGSYINLKLPPVEPPSNDSIHHWWIVGRWLADGHVGSRETSYTISCGHHEVETLVQLLGVHAGTPHDVDTGFQITLKDEDFSIRKILKLCGRGAANKHLPPEAYVLPVEQAKALLEGYLSGDGHYYAERNRYSASSVSKQLLLGMAMLAQRVYGAIASVFPGREAGTATIQGRVVNTKQDWNLSFDVPDVNRKKKLPFVIEDGAWKKVRSADPVGEVETWNLRVEEDESYTAEGCIVKNCPMQYDIVDRLITQFSMEGETVFDPFGGLGTTCYRAIKLKRKGMSVELNGGYYKDSIRYCKMAEMNASVPSLFDLVKEEDAEDLID